MTRDTVFRIASMVKLITSVAALRLVEQGKLSLDGAAARYRSGDRRRRKCSTASMPSRRAAFRPAKRPISLRHLLTHTAGFIYRLWDSRGDEILSGPSTSCRPPNEARLPRTPLMFDPGERWQYGGNIDWVGRIVQAVSGEPLDAHFRKHIFEPLGMNDTSFVISPAQRAREASGHHRQPDGSLKAEPMEPGRSRRRAPQSFPAAAASIRPRRII